jgi:hypothetical protein
MATRYMIEAQSKQAMQRQCQLNLMDDTPITDPALAQRLSDSFAATLNRNGAEQARDWRGVPRLVEYGMHTFPGADESMVHLGGRR